MTSHIKATLFPTKKFNSVEIQFKGSSKSSLALQRFLSTEILATFYKKSVTHSYQRPFPMSFSGTEILDQTSDYSDWISPIKYILCFYNLMQTWLSIISLSKNPFPPTFTLTVFKTNLLLTI